MLTPFSFTGQSIQDPSMQAGMNQYIQQGQNLIDPGQGQVAAADPSAAAAHAGLAKAIAAAIKSNQNNTPMLGDAGTNAMAQAGPAMTTPQAADAYSGMNNGMFPNVPGPTLQSGALARGLMQPQTQNYYSANSWGNNG